MTLSDNCAKKIPKLLLSWPSTNIMHSNKHIRDLGNTKFGNCSFKEPKFLRTKHRCQPRGWTLRKIKARDKRTLSISLDYVIVLHV